MSYFSQAAITIWRWICWCVVTLCLAIASVPASFALAVWLALDFLPKRESKPSISRKPIPQKQIHPYHRRPHFIRKGGDCFLEMMDGQLIPMDAMQINLMVQEGVCVLGGAYVFEKTRELSP